MVFVNLRHGYPATGTDMKVAVAGVMVVVMIALVHGQFANFFLSKFTAAAAADPRVQFQCEASVLLKITTPAKMRKPVKTSSVHSAMLKLRKVQSTLAEWKRVRSHIRTCRSCVSRLC